MNRYISIWFRHLTTDRFIRRRPELKDVPFVLAAPERGRMVIKAASAAAEEKGVQMSMVVADCRAVLPSLQVMDDQPELAEQLLNALAEWCLRYTPVVAVNLPDGLILDASGCPHLWGGERAYLKDIVLKLRGNGYDVRAAMADTVGAAWAIARYGQISPLIESGKEREALLPLSVAALRLEPAITERLGKLGLHQIGSIIDMPRKALRRRFGESLLERLDQALGQAIEVIEPIRPLQPWQERLPSPEPIRTATGIEIALKRLLETLCTRLVKEGKGLRTAVFQCFRVDGNVQQIDIATSRASRNVDHLFKLFGLKIASLEPRLGFELFLVEAPVTEDMITTQEALWHKGSSHNDEEIAELLDRLAVKTGMHTIQRYLPDEHHWPERSFKTAASLQEKPVTDWRTDLPRPLHLLPVPEPIEVTVAIPDYPPMLFRYKNKLHQVVRADGPERIEQEWWIGEGLFRDYYCVEDEQGARYWLFRLGHYAEGEPKWFIHGFFA
jgi:protein ImuB